MTGKKRIDTLLVERGFATSLDEARRLIGAGQVRINEKLHDKAGTEVAEASRIVVKTIRRFVSRGGEKLFAALQGLSIDPSDLICADIGASTGGFTDCLLQYGAAKIYAIDVGYGLLAWKLRNDARVVVRERVNARYLSEKDIAEPLDLAVMDASFISANLLIPPLLLPLVCHPLAYPLAYPLSQGIQSFDYQIVLSVFYLPNLLLVHLCYVFVKYKLI